MTQESEPNHKSRLITGLFVGFLLVLLLCSYLQAAGDARATTYEAIMWGILPRLFTFAITVAWSITMLVVTIKHWKRLNTLSRMMGLAPILIAPLFMIL